MAKIRKERVKDGLKGNRKEDLNRIRGMQRTINPERGPENK